MKRFNHIFDYETLGQNTQKCPVVNKAYFTFDANRFQTKPYTFAELTESVQQVKFDLGHQTKNPYNYQAEESTLEWWKSQGAEAIKHLKPSSHDVTIEEGMQIYVEYLSTGPKIDIWWTRSNTFDPIILWRLARDIGINKKLDDLLKFWLVRDTRSFIDAKFNFTGENGFIPFTDVNKWNTVFVKHDSIHDVAADILRLQTIVRAENGLEIINE